MGDLPTVKSFCCCCDLKTACIVIAAFRIIASIIGILVLVLLFFVFGEVINQYEDGDPNTTADSDFLSLYVMFWIMFLIPIYIINMLFAYWFIQGATSVGRNILTFFHARHNQNGIIYLQKDPSRMKYYVIVLGIQVLMLTLRFSIFCFVYAAIEAYIFICSYSVYKECSTIPHENIVTYTENTAIAYNTGPVAPPPPYSSYENIAQMPQNNGTYVQQMP